MSAVDPFAAYLAAVTEITTPFVDHYPVVVIVTLTDEDGGLLTLKALVNPRWVSGAEYAAVLNSRTLAEDRPVCAECRGWGHTTEPCRTCGGAGTLAETVL